MPTGNATAAPTLPGSYSTFKEAVTAGATAAQEKRWQDALNAFNASLLLAQADSQRSYAGKWIQFVNGQMGNAAPPAAPPASASQRAPAQTVGNTLPGYKGLKWGASLHEFMKLKKAKNMVSKSQDSEGSGVGPGVVSTATDLLLSGFKGAEDADLLSVYSVKDSVYYLFFKGRFSMVIGALENENYPDILGFLKEKYTLAKNFKNSTQDAMGQSANVEVSQFESADGTLVYLIRATRDVSGEIVVGTSFVYVPKDKLTEMRNAAAEKTKDAASEKKSRKAEKLKRDKAKL